MKTRIRERLIGAIALLIIIIVGFLLLLSGQKNDAAKKQASLANQATAPQTISIDSSTEAIPIPAPETNVASSSNQTAAVSAVTNTDTDQVAEATPQPEKTIKVVNKNTLPRLEAETSEQAITVQHSNSPDSTTEPLVAVNQLSKNNHPEANKTIKHPLTKHTKNSPLSLQHPLVKKEQKTKKIASQKQSKKLAISKRSQKSPSKLKKHHSQGSNFWLVQVASFTLDKHAEQLASRLRNHGFPAYSQHILLNHKNIYRVFIGPLPNPELAKMNSRKLHDTMHLQGLVVSYARAYR